MPFARAPSRSGSRPAARQSGEHEADRDLAGHAADHCNSYYPDAGAALAKALLERPLDVTAIVLANDALALGFMRVAMRHGVHVPDDLSIVGFDCVPEGDLVWPGLTSGLSPCSKWGGWRRTALAEIANPGSVPLETIELPMELVRRESSGRARVESGPTPRVSISSGPDSRH